jgi:serine protease inhibitor
MTSSLLGRAFGFLLLAPLTTTVALGCSAALDRTSEARSNLSRDLSPAFSPSDPAALERGNAAFAFDMYQALRGAQGNLAFSPYSLSIALAMTYAGARGTTADENIRRMTDSAH